MLTRRTDNSHLYEKVALRVEAARRLGLDTVRVLDAFHGDGTVWREVARQLDPVEVDVFGIDVKGQDGALKANNLKVLPSLDYSRFDLVDLDAYGVPAQQLAMVAARAPELPVVVTVIMGRQGGLPRLLPEAAGCPWEWHGQSQMVMRKMAWDWWWHYCWTLGYRTSSTIRFEDGMEKVYGVLN